MSDWHADADHLDFIEGLETRIRELEAERDRLREALIAMRELAAVAHEGDSWYAENEGLDAGAIFAQAREALGEKASD